VLILLAPRRRRFQVGSSLEEGLPIGPLEYVLIPLMMAAIFLLAFLIWRRLDNSSITVLAGCARIISG
jgi:hypothetical protein